MITEQRSGAPHHTGSSPEGLANRFLEFERRAGLSRTAALARFAELRDLDQAGQAALTNELTLRRVRQATLRWGGR